MLAESLPGVTSREFLTTLHGMVFGGLFLLAYSGGMVSLGLLRQPGLSEEVLGRQIRLLKTWVLFQAVLAWATTLIGAFVVYPWYRAIPPKGANLSMFPQALLKANAALSPWHQFGMEWKEHLAWFAPILATCVVALVAQAGKRLPERKDVLYACTVLYSIAFVAAAVAGFLGAEITKAAPIH